MTSPQENPKPKTENFFAIETRSLAEYIEDLNTFLSLTAGELWIVMELKSLVKKVAAMGLKGLAYVRSALDVALSSTEERFQQNFSGAET